MDDQPHKLRPGVLLPPSINESQDLLYDKPNDSPTSTSEQGAGQVNVQSPLTSTDMNGALSCLNDGPTAMNQPGTAGVPQNNASASHRKATNSKQSTPVETSEQNVAHAVPAADASIQTRQGSETDIMPPPTAPASMLYSLRSSGRARAPNQQITDPQPIAYLVASAVIMFRAGKGREAEKLGQFTIDISARLRGTNPYRAI